MYGMTMLTIIRIFTVVPFLCSCISVFFLLVCVILASFLLAFCSIAYLYAFLGYPVVCYCLSNMCIYVKVGGLIVV